MSIWKYFKRVPPESVKRKDEGLPEPTGPLSKSVPAKAIELTNAQVQKVQLDKTCDSGLSGWAVSNADTCPEV